MQYIKKTITDISALEILDSRGNPTVEVTVWLNDGTGGRAAVPSGASTGKFEAKELRDGDLRRFCGRGVSSAVKNINETIASALKGFDIYNQAEIDNTLKLLDGTDDKSNLGANAILAVSLACADAAANSLLLPIYKYLGGAMAKRMPIPMMNILNGGAHASNKLDVQEFMIMPVGAESFSEAIRMGTEVYSHLGKLLKSKGYNTAVGDEGGFAPDIESDFDALDLICEAIENAGYNTEKIKIALDAAASEWSDRDGYFLKKSGIKRTSGELVNYWKELSLKYPIASIEDGVGETDTDGWKLLTKTLGDRVRLVGDDLFVTNEKRFRDGISNNIANSILIKPNQIGSLSETLDVIRTAWDNCYGFIISHRSGETEDTFISDLSVAMNSHYIKTGAPCRGERTAKYNRLLRIEAELGKKALYS